MSPLASLFSISMAADNGLMLRNKHVFILSLASTLARLFTGLTADWLSPPLVAVPAPPSSNPDAPSHLFIRKRKQRLSRSMYAALCCVFMAAVFGWSAGLLETERGLWVLSGGTGSLYGALFTLAVSCLLPTLSNQVSELNNSLPSSLRISDPPISAWRGVWSHTL